MPLFCVVTIFVLYFIRIVFYYYNNSPPERALPPSVGRRKAWCLLGQQMGADTAVQLGRTMALLRMSINHQYIL